MKERRCSNVWFRDGQPCARPVNDALTSKFAKESIAFHLRNLHYISQCLNVRGTHGKRQCVDGKNCCCDICIVNSAASLWIRLYLARRTAFVDIPDVSVALGEPSEFILRDWFNNNVTRIVIRATRAELKNCEARLYLDFRFPYCSSDEFHGRSSHFAIVVRTTLVYQIWTI